MAPRAQPATYDEFRRRWEARISRSARATFAAELATLLELERARERRRLCTDPALYREACEETADEIRRYLKPPA
jgi:hypothetical protein